MLDRIIPAEIENDSFSDFIKNLAGTTKANHILEIGSSAGTGSTSAFINGICANDHKPLLHCVEVSKVRFSSLVDYTSRFDFVRCYNMSTVAPEEFPDKDEVIDFYNRIGGSLRRFELSTILEWLEQDLVYVKSAGLRQDAISTIKAQYDIKNFDIVLIDGSEFTGFAEFRKIDGAKVILLDDVNTFKCYEVRTILKSRGDYENIFEDLDLRNGFSIFQKKVD